jgi:hypothetical protein
MPQGSETFTRGESIGMGTMSLLDLFGHQNPDKASSLSPPNSVVAFEAFVMDVDDPPAG